MEPETILQRPAEPIRDALGLRLRPALLAAGLLIGSSVLQILASLERWGPAANGWTRSDFLIEDHRFDYFFPAYPWEPIGSAAQLLGVGLLLLAAGIASFAIAVRPSGKSTSFVMPALLSVIAAAPFGLLGLHALVSGITGRPAFADAAWYVFSLLSIVGLIALAVLSARHSIAWSVASIALIGSTLIGYIVSTFAVAPAVAG
ncbi:hypothetical protein [Naasia lichenicola]|uniref:Uncharacterized protein n=1 Tax=Naasia lichenicola TaxID=2565933 RepID=A0A4S4FJ66_9MICO|nr:hypothetical protein [Naasia lichenicola]THG29892.1 hypothetical protein E6C64_14685 [Naasia lichenicola]